MKFVGLIFSRKFACIILACCLAFSSVLLTGQPVQASQFLSWDDEGSGVGTFDSNEAVIIGTGAIDYIRDCPVGGIKDFVYPFADIYVMRIVPTLGSKLYDISDNPNPVGGTSLGGAFVNQLLGVAAPGGKIPGGRYTIVYDECQDGVLGPEDAIFANAFQVNITTNVPSLPAYITAMKDSASEQAQRLRTASVIMGGVIAFADAKSVKSLILDIYKGKAANMADLVLKGSKIAAGNGIGISPSSEAMATMLNGISMFLAIANDPPDPNFQQLTLLPAVKQASIISTDPIETALSSYDSLAAEEAALAEALLHSLERFQGAGQQGDGEWALIQARAVRFYALLLANHMLLMQDKTDSLNSIIATQTEDFDATELEIWRTNAVSSGFSAEDIQALSNFNILRRDITELRSELADTRFEGYSKSAGQQALIALKATQADQHNKLLEMAAQMTGVITTLSAEATVIDTQPVANAGGPYSAITGQEVTLDGTTSQSSEGRALDYEWDLDTDGQFDDATGVQPTAVFDSISDGYIGLRVTDSTGRQAVDYARVTVTTTNRPPQFTNLSPVETVVGIGSGGASFSVTATDPDGDPVQYAWLLDGVSVATSSSYPYFSNVDSQLGWHRLQVVINDSKPAGVVVHTWQIAGLANDNDSDEWRANVDCNDSAAAIHPGMTELVANTIDDDCNPRTTDGGLVLPPDLFAVTKLEDTNDGICDNDCSLREAIVAANASLEQAITITLMAGIHQLTIQGAQEQEGATGDLDLKPVASQTFTLIGQSAATSIIDAAGLQDRAMTVHGGAVILEKLTIRNADNSMVTMDSSGGAIFVISSGYGPVWEWDYVAPIVPPKPVELTLRDVVLTGNTAYFGGGGISTLAGSARVNIIRSQITNNVDLNAGGGGIRSEGYGQTFTLIDTVVSNNSACWGGGINFHSCQGLAADTLILTNTQIISNVVGGGESLCSAGSLSRGGGVDMAGSMYAYNSVIDYNQAPNAAAIMMSGCQSSSSILQLRNSSVSYNHMANAINDYGAAHIYAYFNPNDIENSIITGNTVANDQASVMTVGTLHMTNTVVSHNEATGIFLNYGPSSVLNSTIHGNSRAGFALQGTRQAGHVTFANTILADNGMGSCESSLYLSQSLQSLGYNLADDDTCFLSATGDMTNTNPLLATETVNGVERSTHHLTTISPAVDAVSAHTCPVDDVDGVGRPQAAQCDIGASEYTPASLLSFAKTHYTVPIAMTTVMLTVVRSGDSVGEITVQYATVEGTAKASTDYETTSGVLTFAPNETTKTIRVPILDSSATEVRSFSLALDAPTGGALLVGIDQAVITLAANASTRDIFLPLINR